MIPSLHVLLSIAKLRSKGLGWRQIAKYLCKEIRVCVSFSTIARWFMKYGKFLSCGYPKTSCNFSDNLLQRRPEDGEASHEDGLPVYLGRTERGVLVLMLSQPYVYWSPALLARKLGVSRKAVWAALKRLERRGLVRKVGDVKLFEGEVIRGAYVVNPSILLGDSLRVHNLRVPNAYVVSEDRGLPLAAALYSGVLRYGEVPITQLELNSDYPVPQGVIEFFKSCGISEVRLYPKPELGVIRYEVRMFPKDVLLSINSYNELRTRYVAATKVAKVIAETELERLSCRRGVLRSVTIL